MFAQLQVAGPSTWSLVMRAVALHFVCILLGITLSFAQSSSNRSQASFDQRPKATSDVSELLGKAGAGDPVAQFRLGLASESRQSMESPPLKTTWEACTPVAWDYQRMIKKLPNGI